MEKGCRQFDQAQLRAQIDYFRKTGFFIFFIKLLLNLKIVKTRKKLIILRERIKHLQGLKSRNSHAF